MHLFKFKKNTNNHQIIMISLEFPPYAKASGMGDNNRDFAVCFKNLYPNNDLRIIMPLYGFESMPFSKDSFGEFELINTNISTTYNYGVRTDKAYLYKILTPDNEIPVYAVYSKAFSYTNKPYQYKDFRLFQFCSAFTNAAIELLKELSKNKSEEFNPKIIHLTDWHTCLHGITKKDNYFRNKKIVHAIHNLGYGYQGKIFPFFALLLFFDNKEIKKILKNKYFKENILLLVENNSEIFHYNQDKNYNQILVNIVKNLNNLNIDKNIEILSNLNNLVVNIFSDKEYDSDFWYNCLAESIKECNSWIVDSSKYFKELRESDIYAPSLSEIINKFQKKGKGILIGTDIKCYDPSEKNKIYFPYSVNNFEEGKLKNKLFLQNQLSFENIQQKNIDTKLVSDFSNTKIKGFLSNNPNSILLFTASRFDVNQKGIDILLVTIKAILKNYPETQLVIAGPDYINSNEKLVQIFIKDIIESSEYAGRIILIDSFIPVWQYFAAVDFFLMPSRFEPGGTSQFQSMRYGCIPIVSNTGGLGEVIISPSENLIQANGFKTNQPLLQCDFPECKFLETIHKALDVHINDKKLLFSIINNAMNYDSSWDKSTKELYEIYYS